MALSETKTRKGFLFKFEYCCFCSRNEAREEKEEAGLTAIIYLDN